jgi:hypothetical protein
VKRRLRLLSIPSAAILATLLAALAIFATASAAWPGANGKIAFKSGDDEIWTMNPDGSDLTQLTSSRVLKMGGFWLVQSEWRDNEAR